MRLKQAQASGKAALRKKNVFSRMLAQWDLQILLVPGILLVLLFSYVPMYGVVMGFQDFQLGDFPGFSQWVGFKHFQTMFADKYFGLAMRNTLVISALKMFIGFPLPIFFAVLLNEMNFQPLKKTVQTVSYLPHFISWVVCATLMFDLMSTDGGAINEFLMWIGFTEETDRLLHRRQVLLGHHVVHGYLEGTRLERDYLHLRYHEHQPGYV